MRKWALCLAAVVLAGALAGCGSSEVRVLSSPEGASSAVSESASRRVSSGASRSEEDAGADSTMPESEAAPEEEPAEAIDVAGDWLHIREENHGDDLPDVYALALSSSGVAGYYYGPFNSEFMLCGEGTYKQDGALVYLELESYIDDPGPFSAVLMFELAEGGMNVSLVEGTLPYYFANDGSAVFYEGR